MNMLGTIVLLVYAILMLVGGVIGYRAAGSKPSLISGVISGLLLFGAFAWSRSNAGGGFLSAAVLALLLAIVFTIRLAKTGRFMPSGMLLAISVIALVVLAIAGFQAPPTP